MDKLNRFDYTVFAVSAVLLILLALTVLVGSRPAQPPRIAYLAPSRGLSNLWLVDPANPQLPPQQITFSETGIYDFEASPDGTSIAYSSQDAATGIREIYLLDVASGTTQRLTNCTAEDADCTTPAWRPDGSVIAYERITLNSALGLGASAPRVWLMDMTATTPTHVPLFTESQILGYGAQWAGNGSRIALYDSVNQSIMIYNFEARQENDRLDVIAAGNGSVGSLSPNGNLLVYPELILDGSFTRAALRLADLDEGQSEYLTPEGERVDDATAVWHPDGTRIAFTRQNLDEGFTGGDQIYLMDVPTRTVTPLVFDSGYTNGALSWSPDGTQLVMQRFPFPSSANSTPEIWTYTLDSGQIRRVVEDGYLPGWVPGQQP